MRVAFLHVVDDSRFKYTKNDHRFLPLMLASVRRTIPNVEILHLTDDSTSAVPGTTTVRRKFSHDNPMLFRMEHLAALSGEFILLDTDVIVQRDISRVFGFDFDVALTWRSDKIVDPSGVDITKLMPFNTGVVFSRNPAFWAECIAFASDKSFGWYTDQVAVAEVAKKFNVLKLHCDNFNYTPKSREDNVAGKYCVHYKGERKSYLLETE